MTGSPEPVYAKSYTKVSLKFRKERVISEFSIRKFFLNLFFCTHRIQFWKICRKHLAKVITKTLLKIREWKYQTDFSKESSWKRYFGHIDCSSELYQKSFNRIEKSEDHFKIWFSSKLFPAMPEKQMWQLCAVFLAQSPNLVETWKIFHSNYFVLKMFHLRGWKLTWQPCHFRLNLRKSFTKILWKRQKKFDFPERVQLSITVSRFTGHVKAYWPSCQMFFAQILKQVPYMKVFKELFFPRSSSVRVKALLTGTPKTLFAKSYIKSSPNVRKTWVKSEFSIKKFFPQSNLLFTWNSVQKKLPKASRQKSYKFFAQNPRIKTKDWFFKRESPKTFFWTRRLRFSTLPEVIQPNWKKRV